MAAIRLGGTVHPSQLCARADDAPSISYRGGGKGFPTGGQVIPSSSLSIYIYVYSGAYSISALPTHTPRKLTHNTQPCTYIKLRFVGDGRVLPSHKTLTARVCVRSSLNTNKAPLTYCQLSEVNLSRINFRRKRFRPSARKPSPVSNYLRIDRPAWRWRDECLSLSHTPCTISLSHPLSIFYSRPPLTRRDQHIRSRSATRSPRMHIFTHTFFTLRSLLPVWMGERGWGMLFRYHRLNEFRILKFKCIQNFQHDVLK